MMNEVNCKAINCRFLLRTGGNPPERKRGKFDQYSDYCMAAGSAGSGKKLGRTYDRSGFAPKWCPLRQEAEQCKK